MAALKYYQMAERCICILYLMSKGDEFLKLEPEEFFRLCREFKIFELDEEQFKRFKHEKLDPVGIVRKGLWPNKNH
jgi:hypothetical protein